MQLAQEAGEAEPDLDPGVVVQLCVPALGPRQQLAAEERPGIPAVGSADEGRPRHGQRQHGELWQDRELALHAGDGDLAVREPEGVALVHEPDRVVPALGELAQRSRLELRELPEQPAHERLVDDDLG